MKRLCLFLFVACLTALLYTSCKKNDLIDYRTTSLVEQARIFFEREIFTPHPNEFRSSGRNALTKKPVWDSAAIIHLSGGEAVWIPLELSANELVRSNVDTSQFFDLSQLTHLLIYKNANGGFEAEVVTSLPDSLFVPGNPFSGIVLVEDWRGNMLKKYKYDHNGKTWSFSPTPGGIAANEATEKHGKGNSSNLIISVCYYIEGYNYGDHDTQGYYWSELIGCDTYYLDEGRGSGGSGTSASDYGDASGRVGGGGGALPHRPFAINAGDHEINNAADYTKCFVNRPGSEYSYQVTICVSQPVPGSRDPWTLNSGDGTSNDGNPLFVGHTFLIFRQTTPNHTIIRNLGFYPSSSVTPYSPSSTAQLNNDQERTFDIALSVTLTSHQFFSMLGYITKADDPGYMYNLNSNNCTTFALDALVAGGVYLPRTIGSWMNGSGLNPGDLGEDIRNLPLTSNMTRTTINGKHINIGSCY